MNYMTYDYNIEKQKNYEDAKNDLIKAMVSISKLDQRQRQQLISEILNSELAAMLLQRWG